MPTIQPEVASALRERRPVVALESSLITHGLPWPVNLETVEAAEATVRASGAVPATIAIIDGEPLVGLTREQLERLARAHGVAKASRRDIAAMIAQRKTASTTVAATMAIAHRAGIDMFATGGIGGVHRGAEHSFDISSDIHELNRTPMAVVCAGAKSVLDIPKTLELLESLGVPVIGFGTSTFPAFYMNSSGLPGQARFDTAIEVAAFLKLHYEWGGRGVLIAQPVEEEIALSAAEFGEALREAESDMKETGPAVTPALLARLANLTSGRTLEANRELIVANARLAASIAVSAMKLRTTGDIPIHRA